MSVESSICTRLGGLIHTESNSVVFILVVVFPFSSDAALCVRVAQKISRLRAATSVKVVNRLYCATPPIFARIVSASVGHRLSHILRSLN